MFPHFSFLPSPRPAMAALSKQRVTIDTFIQFLDRYPTSLPGAILLTLASFFRARSKLDATAGPFSPLSLFDHIKGSTWLYRLVLFTGVKSVNRALNRLVVNHGWKADPPRWNAVKGKGDVVLITGGAAGIGKELVELLSKKTSKIAVLDVSPPTYLASESTSFPASSVLMQDCRERQVLQVRHHQPRCHQGGRRPNSI